jgi:hypothetical protein
MADDVTFYSMTIADRHEPEQREVQFHFMANELAVVCGEVSGHQASNGRATIDRAGALDLRNMLDRWLEDPNR